MRRGPLGMAATFHPNNLAARRTTRICYPRRMDIADAIRAYQPTNEQEAADRRIMLEQLASDPACFERTSPRHFTASAWTVDPSGTQTIMAYHKIYDSWAWIGGHADGERDLAAVALRELREETGVVNARLVELPAGGILSLEALTVDGHEKRGAYVSSHIHLNVTYLFVAAPDDELRVKPDENSGVRWFSLEGALAASTEPWMRNRIYRKLVARTVELRGEL